MYLLKQLHSRVKSISAKWPTSFSKQTMRIGKRLSKQPYFENRKNLTLIFCYRTISSQNTPNSGWNGVI